jgi:hypothetical protein
VSWTESVYLDCVTPNGVSGFVARLARHVDEGTSWLWAHAFLPGGVVAYHDQALPCPGGRTDVEGADPVYALAGPPRASFRRHGPREAMAGAEVTVEVRGHRDPYAPAGAGDTPLRLDASFTPVRAAGGTLPGRTEVLGRVTGRISIGGEGEEHPVEGWAQWHEQHQTGPRFTVPFTYTTLRGDGAGAVLVRGPVRSGGLLWRGREPETVVEADVGPPADTRALVLRLADGATVSGTLSTAHRYAVEINGHPRPGTLVAGELDGAAVTGCVNDWTPAASAVSR